MLRQTSIMKNLYYPGINGLRAMSISMVIIHHLSIQYDIFKSVANKIWLQPFIDFASDGQLGVNIFFVISGFLITSLLLQEEGLNNSISLKHFFARRTLRIFPAYYTLLLIYFLLQSFGYVEISKQSWFTAVTYTKYFNWQLDWYTRHGWSLSIEEQFYLFWPLIFILGDRARKYAALFLVLLVPCIRIYTHYHPIGWMNELTIFKRIDAIGMGCLLALYKDQILERLRPRWSLVLYSSVIALFFLRYALFYARQVHLGFIFLPLGLTHGTLANVLIGLIIMYVVFGPQKALAKFLNMQIINYIGLLSYSIYLWQQIFLCKTTYWINQFPQNLLLIFITALCSYHLIEKPFLKLKARFSDGENALKKLLPAWYRNR